MYESAVIKPEYNMKPYFLVLNGTGDWQNMTKHEGIPYALKANIRFFCQDDYETVNQNSDFNITCSDSGLWNPQLIGCIPKTEDLPLSSTGRFQTEPEEAKSAKQISSIMFILIFIFLGLIVLLDLTTIGRDTKQLWTNLKLQHKRITRKSKRSQRGSADDFKKSTGFMNDGDNEQSTFAIRHRNDL
ncbi:unnamed protein product [Echinostoma caproni]|uniref:Sushi domain-containing protein n=1 Tax=Echinostoma caproni TaxID=27848 RepID=A0A183A601_9TREM|nr:unnamed protein product [Echinostoma caproni]